MERLTPELRRRVLALPAEDLEALRRDIVASQVDPRDIRAVFGLEELRDAVQRITGADPLERSREARVVRARIVLAYTAHERGMTIQEIADYFGITRSSTIFGIRKMHDVLAYPHHYHDYYAIYSQLKTEIS